MLNKALLDPEVSKFIRDNRKKDLPSLILKGSPFHKISIQEIAIQIKGLKVAEKKFPEFYKNPNILYPPKLNLEQTSSEITAKYKASLVEGDNGIDLTGGMGIDTYYLSQNFKDFTYCELNSDLALVAEHNFKELKTKNISVNSGDGLQILKKSTRRFDWAYADPARRDDAGGKVFKFEDCEPNIPENLDLIFSKSGNLMVKSSPILDVTAGINELQHIKEVHIVAVRNEVKELLWILGKNYSDEPLIKTINFEKDGIQEFSGDDYLTDDPTEFSLPETYLYEPNAAIMKSGLFDSIAVKTNTKKLHQHSHLYTSRDLKKFPGRIFKIIEIKQFKPSELKRYFKNKKANITIRNFPDSVENIRKKFKIKDGGSEYIFFTTNIYDEKIIISCKKV
ncbi:class I SAM-dependent methyltransferase [Christiangramia sp. SM2212]|uniref:Class I SAM-dependent methyltransferase n=1 Tax=Christiangramia sediminicola TaxID=3073267 RepID=A0ABU1EPK4_9FLAO|nr:class I SAM-dependent methyltransferase [Christiangramia sp. SM2212]MDR5590325.1 class I SAM-dependent methyltransferase [Christiangramia sp. SM2212]